MDEPYLTEKALGETDLEYPYQVPEDRIFVMGDHRASSVDSRSSVDTATVNVPLTGTATMSKKMAAYVPDANGSGGGTVTYYIWVNAPSTNTYTLSNVLLKDALDETIENRNPTPPEYRQYMEYEVWRSSGQMRGTCRAARKRFKCSSWRTANRPENPFRYR